MVSLPTHHTWGGGGDRKPGEQEWAATQQLGPRAWGCSTDMWTAHAHLQAKDASRMPAGQPQVWVKAGPHTWHCLAGRICPQPAPIWREGATSQRISDTWGEWHPFLGQGACLWVWVGDLPGLALESPCAKCRPEQLCIVGRGACCGSRVPGNCYVGCMHWG